MNCLRILSLLCLALICTPVLANDQLVLITPHQKSIQYEFVPKFKEAYLRLYGKKVEVEWTFLGGASDALRVVLNKYQKTPNSTDIDIFWGGGEHSHQVLDRMGYLSPFPLPPELKREIPQEIMGIPVYNDAETWHGSAMSGFGIFYNKRLLASHKLSEPNSYHNLADPKYREFLSIADPRHSSGTVAVIFSILQKEGWDAGWQLLTRLAANTVRFTHSSTDPIKAVVTGDAAASLSINYYAQAKIQELGSQNLGFILPQGEAVFNCDPISILKGAPNRIVAERFIKFILSAEAQRLLLLPQGAPEGPTTATFGRLAVNRAAYQTKVPTIVGLNPFVDKMKGIVSQSDVVAKTQFIMTDLAGALLITPHKELKAAWQRVIQGGLKAEALAEMGKVPVSLKDLEDLSLRWDDQVVRNNKINEWVKFAREKYQKVAR